jgi:ABC-2 type transport system permease protein
MFLTQLIFLAVGLASAAVTNRPKASAGIATGFMLGTYLLSAIIDINKDLDPLKYLTPFKYFDAKVLSINNSLDGGFVLLTAAVIVVLVAATYYCFKRRDLRI